MMAKTMMILLTAASPGPSTMPGCGTCSMNIFIIKKKKKEGREGGRREKKGREGEEAMTQGQQAMPN